MGHHRARLTQKLTRRNLSVAKKLCPQVTALQLLALREISRHAASFNLRGRVANAGRQMVRDTFWPLADRRKKRCTGIQSELEHTVSKPSEGRWVFRATVRKITISETIRRLWRRRTLRMSLP